MLFLVSPAAGYVTGTTLVVDGRADRLLSASTRSSNTAPLESYLADNTEHRVSGDPDIGTVAFNHDATTSKQSRPLRHAVARRTFPAPMSHCADRRVQAARHGIFHAAGHEGTNLEVTLRTGRKAPERTDVPLFALCRIDLNCQDGRQRRGARPRPNQDRYRPIASRRCRPPQSATPRQSVLDRRGPRRPNATSAARRRPASSRCGVVAPVRRGTLGSAHRRVGGTPPASSHARAEPSVG